MAGRTECRAGRDECNGSGAKVQRAGEQEWLAYHFEVRQDRRRKGTSSHPAP